MTETKAGMFDFEKLTLAELLMTDFLTCDQCERRYDSPILLPCLHTLCEHCVASLASSQNTTQTDQQTTTTTRDESNEATATENTNNDGIQKQIEKTKSEEQLNSINNDESLKTSLTSKINEQKASRKKLTIKADAQLSSVNNNGQKATSTPRNDAQLNSKKSDKHQKTSLMTSTSGEQLNVINGTGNQKSASKSGSEAQVNSRKAKGNQIFSSKPTLRTDTKVNSLNTNGSLSPICESATRSNEQLNSLNTDECTKSVSTQQTDLDFSSSSIDQGLLTFLTINCDVGFEPTSNCDSTKTSNSKRNSSKTSNPSASVPSKPNQNDENLIRFKCPACLSMIEMKDTHLYFVNMFAKHLRDVQRYKEECGRTCEYCKYDGKKTLATTLCLSCHDDMCDGCMKAHQKTRVTRDHQLAPYEQIQKGLYDHDIRNHQSIICVSHKKDVQLFCLTCAVLLCKECQTDDLHVDHTVKPVTKTFLKYKHQLDSFLEGMKRRIPTVADYSNFLMDHSEQIIKAKKEIVKSVNEQTDTLHKLIDEHKARLTDKLTEAIDQELQIIQRKCDDLKVAETSLMKNAEFLNHLLKFGNSDEVLLLHQQITNRLKQLVHMKPDQLTMRLCTDFKPGSATEQNIAIMFGNLNIERVPFNKDDPKQSTLTVASLMPTVLSPPELIRSFDMKESTDSSDLWPTGLVVTNTNYVIVDRDNKKIKIFDKNGKLETQFSGKGDNRLGSPFDATILKNGNIAVTDYKSENVKIFDKCGEFVMSINGNFRYPRGITTNRKGEIVVLDCHRLEITTLNAETGECISTISGSDGINNHLVDPYYIAVTDDDNFVVTDHAAPNIKVFNQQGDCLAQYGTYGTYQGQVLQPYGVCTDHHGYIFVADHQNSRIHLLLPDGRFSKFLLTKRDKVKNPVAIGIDENDQLVVAEALGKVKVWKYM